MGAKRGSYRVLVEKPEGRMPLERPRSRWEDDIKMDLLDVEWGMDGISLAEDMDRWRTLVNVLMNILCS